MYDRLPAESPFTGNSTDSSMQIVKKKRWKTPNCLVLDGPCPPNLRSNAGFTISSSAFFIKPKMAPISSTTRMLLSVTMGTLAPLPPYLPGKVHRTETGQQIPRVTILQQ